jgi:Tol biopolymer transport system component
MKKSVIIGIVVGILILGVIGFFLLVPSLSKGEDGFSPSAGESEIIPNDLTQITSFTEQEGKAVDPDFSPDGSQIVFCLVKEILEDSELYVINADGTGPTKIGLGFDPSWSPVEDKIAYTFNDQIYTMNSDGKEITKLTTEYSSMAPGWSPDGTKITYTYYEDGKASVWIMNSDGTGKTPLTTSMDGECSISSFSYDGLKIVYLKGPRWYTHIEMMPTKLNEIWIMNSDGSNKHMIYAPGDSYQWPFQRAWNKNNKILFMKNGILEDKLPKMFVINSDGTNPKKMVSPTYSSGMPDYFYLDPVWDNTYTKVVAVRVIIGGAQNIVTFSWTE